MATLCPYCENELIFERGKPGTFGAHCGQCGKKLAVIVPENPDEPIQTASLKSQVDADARAATPQTPAPEVSAPDDQATMVSAPRLSAADEGATLVTSPAAADEDKTLVSDAVFRETPETDEAAAQAREAAKAPTKPIPEEPADAEPAEQEQIEGRLGGYEVVRLLGRGGMGDVYLARQLSLDRSVALKVMRPDWAQNAVFLSRFTREAYAAAQLTHHNVVQIHDIGADRGYNYFSMEFVTGDSLGGILKDKGPIDIEEAVGYVLQAARGLRFAHDEGMIHRDVKPDNLMLNDQGVVKVADLGLVKTPGSEKTMEDAALAAKMGGVNVTAVGAAMGTPAYMAPEQARDAAHVDMRADVYSLGCTLYALVTGRPVFEGKTALEVITKHATESIVPPEMIVSRVPKLLSAIISKMVAKHPDDRYQTMEEVVKALEDFLGIDSAGPFTPRDEHARLLKAAVEKFNSAPMARVRAGLIAAFAAACFFLVIWFAKSGRPIMAGGSVGLGVLSGLCYFVITGVLEKSYVFRRVRQVVFSNTIGDWLMFTFGSAVIVGVLMLFNWLWIWLAFLAVAFGLALGFYLAVDRTLKKQRSGPLESVREMLKGMRLRGLEENSLRQFVCRYSGRHWEPMYEALFGYEAKILARKQWGVGESGRMRKKSGYLRDPIIDWAEARIKARSEAKERKHLETVEEKAMAEKGMTVSVARERARQEAEALVAQATLIKQEAERVAVETLKTVVRAGGARAEMPTMLAGALAGMSAQPDPEQDGSPGADGQPGNQTVKKRMGGGGNALLEMWLGARTRFIVGALLCAACLMWMYQNNVFGTRGLAAGGTAVMREYRGGIDQGSDRRIAETYQTAKGDDASGMAPLSVPLVPGWVLSKFFNSFVPGIAGLILLVSSFVPGARMTLFAGPAAAIVFLGPAALEPAMPYVLPHLSRRYQAIAHNYGAVIVVVVLLALGLKFGKRKTTERFKK